MVRGPEWSRTVENSYTSDNCKSTEVYKLLSDVNHMLYVPVDISRYQ